MKKISLVSVVCLAALLSGCAHRYDLLLSNGVRITNVSKPVLNRDAGVYAYKDGTGATREIPAGRVVEISPAGSTKPAQFKNH